MTTKESFTETEWSAMRDAPHMVAMAMTMAGASGVFGSIGEMFASAKAIHAATNSTRVLIRLLVGPSELTDAQESLKKIVTQQAERTPEALQASAITLAQSALATIGAKAPEERSWYRSWLIEVAKSVSEASKEGGFLGVGGERVSEKERDFLSRLELALQ